jgi:hypothetical protein
MRVVTVSVDSFVGSVLSFETLLRFTIEVEDDRTTLVVPRLGKMGDQLGLDRGERIWVQRTQRQLQIQDQQSLGNFSTRKLFIPQYDPIDLTVDEDEMDDMSRPSPQSLVDGNDSVISDSNGTVSRKRSLDNMNDTEGSKGQEAKRRRIGESQRPTPSPTPEPMVMAEIVTTPVFNDAPKQLLLRSCALALDHIGFDGASKEAMESLWGEVDSCRIYEFLDVILTDQKQI